MRGFGRLLRLHFALLGARVLPRFVLGGVLVTAVLAVILGPQERGRGFEVLASTADLVIVTVATVLAVLGAVAVSGDASQGALRGVLLRPVARPAIVLSQAVVLVTVTIALYVLALLVALPLTALTHGFDHVKLGDFVITEASVMTHHSLRLLLLPIPALCCFALLALLVSVVIEDVAAAVVVALVLVEGPLFAGKVITDLPAWTFSERALHPVAVLKALGTGDNTREAMVSAAGYTFDALLIPILWGVLLLTAAILLFSRREVHE